MSVVKNLLTFRSTALSVLLLAVAGCATTGSNAPLVDGPAVEDIVTPYEDAMMCLNGKIDSRLSFAVGGIPDQTGREQNSNEGAGRFVTQGAGDIVQSALFKAGVTVINRRDMGSAAMEAQWGVRDLSAQRQANFVITGSINSLDFLPGGGATLSLRGVGPRYRQNRILVGMDLALTNSATGQIVANIALHKQLFADELGFAATRFVDGRLVDADIGVARREAVHYALRQMLQLATFELLVQLMPPEKYVECAATIDPRKGAVRGGRTSGEQLRQFEESQAEQEAGAPTLATQGAAVGDTVPSAAQLEDSINADANNTPSATNAALNQNAHRMGRPMDARRVDDVEYAAAETLPMHVLLDRPFYDKVLDRGVSARTACKLAISLDQLAGGITHA